MPTDDAVALRLLTGAARTVWDLASGVQTFERAMSQLSTLATEAAGGDLAGVTWVRHGREPTTVAATDPLAVALDEAQYRAGRGPCLDAALVGRLVRVDDMATDGSWPEFAQAASERNIRASISVPIAAGRTFGAMNVYSREANRFRHVGAAITDTIAAQAAVAAALDEARRTAEQLGVAMESRSVIEQAKGVIMSALACDADTAFDALTSQSQHENRKLRDIAVELVERQRQRPGQPKR